MITNPSPQQVDIFDYLKNDTGNMVIEAVAGAGKTSTIIHGSELLPRTARILFSAFNVSTVDELKTRLPNYIDCRTFHGASLMALREILPQKWEVNKFKSRNLLERICPDRRERNKYNQFVTKVVDLMKSTPGVPAAELVKLHSPICEGNLEIGIDYAEQVFELGNTVLEQIDFGDMLWLTYHLNAPFRNQYDIMFVDEAQDFSPLQHALMQRMLKPNGRVIVVGDSRQAIYAFRGADANSMNKLKDTFNCREFPLSVSYRCASSIVDEVYNMCMAGHTIQSHPNADRGSVNRPSSWSDYDLGDDDAVICRNNAPLVRLAFSLLSQRRRATVLGRDIGLGLLSLVKKLKPKDITELYTKLHDYRAKEIAKNPDNENVINDRCDCLEVFMHNSASLDALSNTVTNLFADKDTQGIVLGTVHKMKGKEYTNTFILDPWLMPSKYAKQDWQVQQEDNIQYVAITRAKQNLTYIDTNNQQ